MFRRSAFMDYATADGSSKWLTRKQLQPNPVMAGVSFDLGTGAIAVAVTGYNNGRYEVTVGGKLVHEGVIES